MKLQFQGQTQPNIGLGTELQIIHNQTAQPLPLAPEILKEIQDPRIRIGLFKSVLELDTHLHPQLNQALQELKQMIDLLRQACTKRNATLLSTGTHPLAHWSKLQPVPDPTRQPMLERLAWVGKRMAIYGLRIHVGVPTGEYAIAIMGGLRVLIPLLVALSASSPFWNGYDTGLASARARIIENVPNAGIPPKIINWAEYVRYVKTLRSAEAIQDLSEIWWDIRPAHKRGTVRVQAADTPHTLREMALLAAIVYASVYTLVQNYQNGEPFLEQQHWIVRENKWRAARFGLEAHLILNSQGHTLPLIEFLHHTLQKISNTAKQLHCYNQLENIHEILAYGPGYIRQKMLTRLMPLQQATLKIATELETNTLTNPSF